MTEAVAVITERDQDVGLDRRPHRGVKRRVAKFGAARQQFMRDAATGDRGSADDEPAVVADLLETHQKQVGEIRRQRTADRRRPRPAPR